MIVRKVKSLKGVYLDKGNAAFNCGSYTLHVTAFGKSIRVFLVGELVIYELQESLQLSEIVGLMEWLESYNKTAKWTTYKDTEIIQPCWYHKLPRVKIERQ